MFDCGQRSWRNTDAYVGENYGIVTEAGLDALHLLARTEGILLDPVYTSKAMSGVIDRIQTGRNSRGIYGGVRAYRWESSTVRVCARVDFTRRLSAITLI